MTPDWFEAGSPVDAPLLERAENGCSWRLCRVPAGAFSLLVESDWEKYLLTQAKNRNVGFDNVMAEAIDILVWVANRGGTRKAIEIDPPILLWGSEPVIVRGHHLCAIGIHMTDHQKRLDAITAIVGITK